MGDGFKITIGMSTVSIMSNLNNLTGATDKTKQMIINFCNSDLDGKVTNDIELTMLDTWAKGEERIPMPQKPRGKNYTKGFVFNFNLGKETVGKADRYENSRQEFIYAKGKNSSMTCIDHYSPNALYVDMLADDDNDGFADNRCINHGLPNNKSFDTYIDDVLNGELKKVE